MKYTRAENDLYNQYIGQGLMNEDTNYGRHFWFSQGNYIYDKKLQLYLVTGKVSGLYTIKAVHSRFKFEFEVNVVSREYFTVAFKFLRHLDKDGKMTSRTIWNPSDARFLINNLNLIYSPQANVIFNNIGADWIEVGEKLGEDRLESQVFLDLIVGQKNKKADLNIFFVGNYGVNSNEARKVVTGTYFTSEKSLVVDDKPDKTRVIATADSEPFLVTLAHEVAHFLVDMNGLSEKFIHHSRNNILLSENIESTKIDRNLVKLFR